MFPLDCVRILLIRVLVEMLDRVVREEAAEHIILAGDGDHSLTARAFTRPPWEKGDRHLRLDVRTP